MEDTLDTKLSTTVYSWVMPETEAMLAEMAELPLRYRELQRDVVKALSLDLSDSYVACQTSHVTLLATSSLGGLPAYNRAGRYRYCLTQLLYEEAQARGLYEVP
jgi:hypothetical protein